MNSLAMASKALQEHYAAASTAYAVQATTHYQTYLERPPGADLPPQKVCNLDPIAPRPRRSWTLKATAIALRGTLHSVTASAPLVAWGMFFFATIESFPAWKSKFGRPTPSTRCCLRSCVCSDNLTHWLISTQVWIMAVGGFFVLLGVWSLGWRVIRTVGSKIATVDFHTAWCIEFGSTLSVVIATICVEINQ